MGAFCADKQPLSIRSPAAFTFIENVFAMAIVGVFFGGLYAMNAQCLYVLSSGRGTVVAEQSLQDRMEQLRTCSWSQLTDASYIQNSLMNSATNGARNLGQVTETVTVNAYPTALSPAISVVRSNGTASTASSNASIANGDIVRVDIALSWKAGPGGRQRSQSVTTVIAENNP